ncbi:MAG: MFS transporter [bacterium]|nr:MFS transporter [bacterium]
MPSYETYQELTQTMVAFIAERPRKMRLMLRDLVGNARVLVITEPCWSIPIGWFSTYTVLYMQALNLTKLDIGWVTFLFVAAQIPATLIGGYIADHWGRKRTVMWFDLICWGIPLLIWLFAKTKTDFILAAVFNGFAWIVLPAWLCLFAEDIPPEKTANNFGFLYVVFFLSGMFVPVGGYFVAQFGTELGCRLMYGLALILVASGLTIRWIHLKEPKRNVTVALNQQFVCNMKNSFSEYLAAMKYGWNNLTLRILFFAGCIGGLQYTIWTTFQPLYLTDTNGLQFNQAIISWLPPVSAITMILIILLIIPQVRANQIKFYLRISYGLIVLSSIIFLLIPAGQFLLLLLFASISAGGLGLLSPLRDSLVMNSLTEDRYRAKVLAVSGLGAMLFSLPGGPLGASLYTFHPKLPFITALGLQCINFGLLCYLQKVNACGVTEIDNLR